MRRIIVSPAAEEDASEIWAFIAKENIPAADRWLKRLSELFSTLGFQPVLGKSLPELASNLRFLPFGSYLVFYRPSKDAVEIVRILHGSRNLSSDFFRD